MHSADEVKTMRRFLTSSAALAAGLTLFLSGCSGESPTEPKPVPTASGGACAVTIALPPGPIVASTSPSASQIVYITLPAQVKRNGQPVPDNTSVTFTIDAPGRFAENGLQTLVSRTKDGAANASPWSVSTGPAIVKASFECASAIVEVDFAPCPDCLPFISSVNPDNGSTAGGEVVTISGGHFTDFPLSTVTFGGVPVSPDSVPPVTNTSINVHTPQHAAGTVEVCATFFGGNFRSNCVPFTYRGGGGGGTCNTDSSFFISSVSPNSGPANGGTVVTIAGGGFPTTPGAAQVNFGGVAAQITAVTATAITVSTPQRTLANPAVGETVDVTVTDLGSPTLRCARLVGAFSYTPAALDPVIYSVSPRTGPNDATTRVSIFGTGFQFPMQVFLTAGNCGGQQIEAPIVGSITQTQIVASFPAAIGAYVCLSGQIADVTVLNPVTGKKNTLSGAFKYYPCPTITSIAPDQGPYIGGTTVVITGHNFEDPATVSGAGIAWEPISVSATTIIARTAPIFVSSCADITGPVLVNSTVLSCPNAQGPTWRYWVRTVAPIITGIAPQAIPEAGGVLVTVDGANFFDNMRVVVHLPGGDIRIVPTIVSTTRLTFTAPAFTGAFKTQPCTVGTTAGVQNIDTAVDFDVLNVTTTCSATDQIVYQPTDRTCRITVAPLAIVTATLPNGTSGTPYGASLVATGGTPPYTWSLASGTLPTGLSLSGAGAISGTPTATGVFNFAVLVTDSAARTATGNLSITIN
jgi:hypothetical protein